MDDSESIYVLPKFKRRFFSSFLALGTTHISSIPTQKSSTWSELRVEWRRSSTSAVLGAARRPPGGEMRRLKCISPKIGKMLQQKSCRLGKPSFKKYRNFMKYFHKTVTPPPRTAFMKSLFRFCHWFWGIYYFWIRDMKSDWPPRPVCEIIS